MGVSKAISLDLTDEQAALADAVRRFLTDAGLPRARYGEPVARRDDLWTGLADLGVAGALVPEQAGGLGLTLGDLGGVLAEAGRACYTGPLVSCAIGAATLLAAGDDELLPALASGDKVAVVVDDPGVHVDEDRVEGRAALVPDAGVADVLVVVAPTSVVAVDVPGAGVEVTPVATVDGSRSFAAVEFDAVPGRRVLDEPDDATAAMRDHTLAAWTADGLGAAAAIFDLATQHAHSRVQFGVPIGSFQAVQHALVDAYAVLEAGKAGVSAALVASGGEPTERHRAAVMGGAWCCDGFAQVAAAAIQVLGGIGFTWEHDAHLYYKRLLSLETAYGGSATHLAELAALTV